VQSSLPLLESPWVFTQSHPLSTADVIAEAQKRGLALSPVILRELYRSGDLCPIVQVTHRSVRPSVPLSDEPPRGASRQTELRAALIAGQVRDPAMEPFRPSMRFDGRRATDPRRWWNGLIYSRWQLLAVPDLRTRLAQRPAGRKGQSFRLPRQDEWSRPIMERHRQVAAADCLGTSVSADT
jgi:hypothetical protein